jgi:hypothetical protein
VREGEIWSRCDGEADSAAVNGHSPLAVNFQHLVLDKLFICYLSLESGWKATWHSNRNDR